MKTKPDSKFIQDVLDRWAEWKRLYPKDYFMRFFHLYDDELLPVLRTLRAHMRERKK